MVLASIVIGIVLTAYLGIIFSDWAAWLVAGMLGLFLALFGSLTVAVQAGSLEIKFGVGWVRKRFELEEIDSCEVVGNPWWYGWGIKRIPKGWLFNVSGRDAIELLMRNGTVYRIGTDEPEKLSRAIQMRLGGEGS